MHPTGQILNYNDRSEYQRRGTQHFHEPVHIENAPKINEDEDEVVTKFMNKDISSSLPNANQYP